MPELIGVPLRMRVGDGEEFEVGTIWPDVEIAPADEPGVYVRVQDITPADMASVFRQMADSLEAQPA